jgi:YD repeat-containing protein
MSTNIGIVIPADFSMLTLTPLPSPETIYTASFSIILTAENYGGAGDVFPDPVSGLDIGYGLQLIGPPNHRFPNGAPNTANVPFILQAMGVPSAAIGTAANPGAATIAVDNVLSISGAVWTADSLESALTGAISQWLPAFNLSLTNALTALQLVIAGVAIPKLNTLLNNSGISYLATPAGINTQEYLALLDMYYAGGQKLIGSNAIPLLPSNLLSALNVGNRAQAWYEIRYQSNGNQLAGIAWRRYYDSQLFGLFSNPANPSQAEVLQAYQMLTQNRQSIIAYEASYGVDPDSNAQALYKNQIAAANTMYNVTGTSSAVQTLAQAFAPAETVLLAMLASQSPLLRQLSPNFATPTNIFLASNSDPTVNAALGDAILSSKGQPLSPQLTSDDLAEASANHILIATGDGQALTGGFGNDILVAGAGNETLTSGFGSDTIIAGGGADVISLRGTSAIVDFEFQGQTGLNETVSATQFALGALDVGGTQLTGSTVAPTKSSDGKTLTWNTSQATYCYDIAGGSLTISGGILGSGSGDSIVINNFNLSAAQTVGFLGFSLQGLCQITCGATAGVDPPPPNFSAGSTQAYTFSTDVASDTAQTVTLTLSGVNTADFEASVANQVVQQNGDGTFSFLLPAGATSVSFSLTNTADVGASASLQLSASLTDPSIPSLAAVTSNTITQNFVEPTDDPFTTPSGTPLYSTGTNVAGASGVTYDSYSTFDNGSPVSAVSSGNNFIDVGPEPNSADQLVGAANESISGGTGSDTIYAGFGYEGSDGGVNVIVGNGGQDQIDAGYYHPLIGGGTGGPLTVSIYADSQVDLPTAIADANLATATGKQGDFIAEGSTDSTIVGGTGNDLLVDDGDTSGVIVAGSGNDTILGGVEIVEYFPQGLAGTTWSATFSNNQLSFGGSFYYTAGGEDEFLSGVGVVPPQGYEGNVDAYGQALGGGNDTIFGGAGQDVVVLSNGNNEVQLGVGDSTVMGGMGDNTIIGGGGNNSIIGGGGNDYIADGSGNSLIVGNGGNNTLIGGSGNDTLFAGSGTTNWATTETGNNYVDGGSGNAVIFGSDGNDTLIAGDGNSTILGGAGNESIVGGDGNDQLVGGSGSDTIDAQGTTGTDLIQAGGGSTTIYGGDGSDHIQGTTGTDLIYAGDGGTAATPTEVDVGTGNTTVYGGDGIDSIFGGSGTDVLYAGDGGTDDNPTLVKAGTGVTTIYGGAGTDGLVDTAGGSDSIVAGSGDDTLVGSGNDTLIAGAGNDYFSGTGNLTDVFSSYSGDALIDTSSSTVTLEFTPDVSVSDLTVSVDVSADNTPELVLQGDDGAITVAGGLNPGTIGSVVFEGQQTLTLTQLIQQADASGDTNPTTVAGANGNLIFDTSEGDAVSAGSGADTVSAWGDSDTLSAGSGGTLINAEGADNLVYGGSGNDTLDALGAGTTLQGGTGNELFEVSDPTDVVVGSGSGSDTIQSSVSYALPTAVDTLTLTGSANLMATGNLDAANLITGNSGNDALVAGSGSDTLVSGTGVDTFIGGSGGDTYVINNSLDVIRPATPGADAAQSSVSYTLQAAVGSLKLTGSNNLTATDAYGYAAITGNAGNDTLVGGSGRDTLIAGLGADTLVAGSGANTLVVNNAADVIQGASSADTVEASINYTMGRGVDNLVLTGSANLEATGNSDAANSITANAGIDTLIAGSGADTLTGNAGDTYVLNSGFGLDVIQQANGSGILQFGAGITAANLDLGLTQDSAGNPALLIQDGSSAVTVDGGLNGSISEFEFSNGTTLNLAELAAQAQFTPATVTGAAGQTIFNNTPDASLTGGLGNDTIYGLGADETIVAGTGNQQIYGISGGDVLAGSTGDDTLHGGAGEETLIGGTGNTVMYGGTGDDFYQLTQGATATIYGSSSPGAEVIFLPVGMTMSDFTTIQDPNGDLILQSLIDNTTAIVKGFYSSSTSNKTWLIADNTEAPQFLGHFAGTPISTGGNSYTQEMTQLREAYAAKLGTLLTAIGQNGGSITDPTNVIVPGTPYENYQFNGESIQNVTVSGALDTLAAGASEHETTTTTTTTVPITETITTPVYRSETVGGAYTDFFFIPSSSVVNAEDQPTNAINQANSNLIDLNDFNNGETGTEYGVTVALPTQTELVQTGTETRTITVPTNINVTNETQSFTAENITGDGGNDDIYANAPFVGTVNTGNGNDYVYLGAQSTGETLDLDYNPDFAIEGPLFGGSFSPPLGAFIQAGSGNDTIVGTGGADTIAAGTGFDFLDGWMGTTYYVPMQGDSTDVIADDVKASPYGSGQYPQTTLVLPAGVTPQNLQYRIFQNPSLDPVPYSNSAADSQILQLRYGDSTVLVQFADPNSATGFPASPALPGVDQFQFANGEVLTRAQLIAQATLLPNDFNPVVSPSGATPVTGWVVAASTLFTATDSADDPITWYQISDDGAGGGHFVLNGTPQYSQFEVSQQQLSQLTYVAGNAGATDNIQVSVFDGAIWSTPTTFGVTAVTAPTNLFETNGPDQQIVGSDTGPDTLIGGYAGDTLVGSSGEDTFIYGSGSGAETIEEQGSTTSSGNTLQLGSGLTASAISLGENADGALVVTLDNLGDAVLVAGFNPIDPLNSMSLQNFDFSDGSNLNFLQLIGDSTASSGTVDNADGSSTNYSFNPGTGTLYSASVTNAQGQMTGSYVLTSDGSATQTLYMYNSDGSYTDTVTTTPSGGSATTTVNSYYLGGQLQSADTTNPDGSTDDYSYNSQGQILTAYITNADGSTNDSSYTYNSDGSYTDTVVTTPAGGNSTVTVYSYYPGGQLESESIGNPDGSSSYYSYNAQGQTLIAEINYANGTSSDSIYSYYPGGQLQSESIQNPDGSSSYDSYSATGQTLIALITNADGSSNESSYTYNADGSYTDAVVTTSAGGSSTTTVYGYNPQGQLQSADTTNPDGSTDDYSYNNQGQILTADITNADGSTNNSTYVYNSDGSYSDTVVTTSAGGSSTTTVYGYNTAGSLITADTANPDGSTDDYGYNSQGQILTADITNADGSTSDSTYSYNADGSYTDTVVSASAGGSATTTVYGYGAQGSLLTADTTNPDGSTDDYGYSSQGQILSADLTNADGSTDDSTYAYNADGSYTDTVVTTPAGGSATTTVYGYNTQGQLQSADTTNPDGSTDNYSYNVQGEILSADTTNPNGSSNNSTYAYNADGSYTDTVVTTPSVGGATTTVYSYNAQGQLESDNTTDPSGSTDAYSYNARGQILTADITNPDGSSNDSTYAYNADGSYSDTVVMTPGGGGATTTVYSYDPQGQLLGAETTNPDGSTDDYTYGGQGQLLGADITEVDGSTNDSTYAYNSDGSYTDTVVTTPAGGSATTTVYGYNAQGSLLTVDITNPDSSTDDYTYNAQGQLLSADVTNSDGSTNDSTYVYNSDGSYSDTVVTTPAGGSATTTVYGYGTQGSLLTVDTTNPDTSTDDYSYNAQGQILTADITNADGSTNDSTYSYNSDGSYTNTVVASPALGGATTTVYGYGTQGSLLTADTTNPDGSTDNYSYNSQGQILSADITNADGSTSDSSYAYNSDASYTDTVVTTPAGGNATSTVYSYDPQGQLTNVESQNPDQSIVDYAYNDQGQLVNENDYVPAADGSYTDTWSMSNGSHGEYWWNASTFEYQDTWQNADGSSFTDTYQYASGGSPGGSGVSFTETYSDSSGDSGTRNYSAATGVTTVTWDSVQSGLTSGTSANDSGFFGLQLDGEVSNTTNDLTYFNPLVSANFNAFLAAHG